MASTKGPSAAWRPRGRRSASGGATNTNINTTRAGRLAEIDRQAQQHAAAAEGAHGAERIAGRRPVPQQKAGACHSQRRRQLGDQRAVAKEGQDADTDGGEQQHKGGRRFALFRLAGQADHDKRTEGPRYGQGDANLAGVMGHFPPAQPSDNERRPDQDHRQPVPLHSLEYVQKEADDEADRCNKHQFLDGRVGGKIGRPEAQQIAGAEGQRNSAAGQQRPEARTAGKAQNPGQDQRSQQRHGGDGDQRIQGSIGHGVPRVSIGDQFVLCKLLHRGNRSARLSPPR